MNGHPFTRIFAARCPEAEENLREVDTKGEESVEYHLDRDGSTERMTMSSSRQQKKAKAVR